MKGWAERGMMEQRWRRVWILFSVLFPPLWSTRWFFPKVKERSSEGRKSNCSWCSTLSASLGDLLQYHSLLPCTGIHRLWWKVGVIHTSDLHSRWLSVTTDHVCTPLFLREKGTRVNRERRRVAKWICDRSQKKCSNSKHMTASHGLIYNVTNLTTDFFVTVRMPQSIFQPLSLVACWMIRLLGWMWVNSAQCGP